MPFTRLNKTCSSPRKARGLIGPRPETMALGNLTPFTTGRRVNSDLSQIGNFFGKCTSRRFGMTLESNTI